MRPLMLLIALVSPAAPALAQVMPPDVEKTLWCGLALDALATDIVAGGGADKEMRDRANSLLSRGHLAMLASGYSDEQVAALDARIAAGVAAELLSDASEPTYSYEDCVAFAEKAP